MLRELTIQKRHYANITDCLQRGFFSLNKELLSTTDYFYSCTYFNLVHPTTAEKRD